MYCREVTTVLEPPKCSLHVAMWRRPVQGFELRFIYVVGRCDSLELSWMSGIPRREGPVVPPEHARRDEVTLPRGRHMEISGRHGQANSMAN